MTARGLLPATLLLASAAAATGAAGAFFAGAGAAAPLLAPFFGAVWAMALLPGMLVNASGHPAPLTGQTPGDGRTPSAVGGRRLALAALLLAPFLALPLGMAGAGLVSAKNLGAALGAALIAVAFSLFAAGAGRLLAAFFAAPDANAAEKKTRRPEAAAAAATLVAAALLASPWWTGSLLTNADDAGKLAAVWAAPAAMLGSALPGLNFSCLPGLYHVWMGSLCPTPRSCLVAALAYAVPAAVLWLLARWLRPARPVAENDAPAAP